MRLDPTTILISAALIGLGALVADRVLEPKHRSFAQCIVDESRGLPSGDVASVAIVACRELFPNGTLRLPAGASPTPNTPSDSVPVH